MYQKRYGPALDLSQKALVGREQFLGKDHHDYFRSLYLQARLHHLKEYSKADPLHEKTCSGVERVIGIEHTETKKSYADYEYIKEAQG